MSTHSNYSAPAQSSNIGCRRFNCIRTVAVYAAVVIATVAQIAGTTKASDWADIFPAGAQVTKLADGFKFTEGPAWHPDGFLLFTDIPNERIVKYAAGKLSDFYAPSGRCNGLMCDAQGFVYACQGGTGRVLMLNADGSLNKVIAKEFQGKRFNQPNDLALDADGGLYFTDPYYGGDQKLPQPMMAVYYIDARGHVSRVIDTLKRPNGVTVSPNGKWLYVAEPNLGQIYRYPVLSPGKLGSGKMIFQGNKELDGQGGPDGMAHDIRGNLYATYKGIVVIDPDGKALGRIATPEQPANCAFGGSDNKTLYITARTGLYKIDLKIPGMPLQKTGPIVAQVEQKVPARNKGLQVRPVSAKETKTNTVNLQGLVLQIPENWKSERPSNRLRLAQYLIPAAEGETAKTEFVVFPPFGGSVDDNLGRWVRQFDTKNLKMKTVKGKSKQGVYYLLDISGTYKKPDGPPFLRKTIDAPDHQMLAVILNLPGKGNFFLKMVGPQKTVAKQVKNFRNSFGAQAESEKEYRIKN